MDCFTLTEVPECQNSQEHGVFSFSVFYFKETRNFLHSSMQFFCNFLHYVLKNTHT